MTGRSIIWRSIHSTESDLEESFQDWQDGNHDISFRRCAIVKLVKWIGIKLQNVMVYDGVSKVDGFLDHM